MNDKLQKLWHIGFLASLSVVAVGCVNTPETGKHLFILSGQSNMTGTLKQSFTQTVETQYGKENVAVVISMKSGRGIRFWVEDYRAPGSRSLSEKKNKDNGSQYPFLLETAENAAHETPYETIGFIWMQGESDGLNGLSEAYQESFLKLIKQLRTDLRGRDLYFVIGRISDYGLDGHKYEHWQRVRKAQVDLGEMTGGAWIDTDDLNGGDADKPNGDLHYPRKGAVTLGQRFANRAVEMINTK